MRVLPLILSLLFFLNPLNAWTEQNQIVPSCDNFQNEQAQKDHSSDVIIESIQEIFKHFYQSSEAYSLPPYEFLKHGELKGFGSIYNPVSKGKNSFVSNLFQAKKSQYYVSCDKDPKNPLCLTPPSYIWGGMGWYERDKDGEFFLNLHGNNELTTKLTRHPGLDCSGFSYAVYSKAKLRVTTDLTRTPSFDTADTTPARSYLETSNPMSCFKDVNPESSTSSSIFPGDIIVWPTHMIIVDSVGNDPFGINHIEKSNDCTIRNIKPENATMVVVNSKGGFTRHSGKTIESYSSNSYFRLAQKKINSNPGKLLTGTGMGISKQYAKEFFYTSPKQFFNLARTWCKARFDKNANLKQDIKIIRHKAFFKGQEKPCACFSREQDILSLRPTM